jgi:hypothetical protein
MRRQKPVFSLDWWTRTTVLKTSCSTTNTQKKKKATSHHQRSPRYCGKWKINVYFVATNLLHNRAIWWWPTDHLECVINVAWHRVICCTLFNDAIIIIIITTTSCEVLSVVPVPYHSRWSLSFHLFLGRPMLLFPFVLHLSGCLGILCVPNLSTCCSHSRWYCCIS